MIAELFEIQKVLEERSRHVGRLLQTTRHYLMEQTAFPGVAAFWTPDSNMQYTGIVIGRNTSGGYVIVYMPTPVFESASDSDIRVWVAGQNAVYKKSTDTADDAKSAFKRAEEVRIMQDLMAKYPEELPK